MADLEKGPFPIKEPALRIDPRELGDRPGIDIRKRVRLFAINELGDAAISSEKVDDLELLTDETFGNGDRIEEGRHATEVLIGALGRTVFVAVGDNSTISPNVNQDNRIEGESGNGLLLVSALATTAGYEDVDDSETRKRVWFGVDLAA